MASVYAATHRNGSRVAVKMLHGPLSLDPDIRRRFLREGYVANKVNHRGAVQVIDDEEDEDGSAFLVMELLRGESLDVAWERSLRRMTLPDVLAIVHELLDTLGSAHKSGIVHRDIKPANLFLTTDGKVKVLDFGIARLLEVTAGHAHTHTGRAVGTPAFMPPEQALGKTRDIDGQTDLWAVGATMFTLLSGHDVHEAENVSEQLIFAGTKHARSLGVVLPEAPKEVALVVDRALSFDKAGRWADARAMQEAVAAAHLAVLGQPVATSIAALVPSENVDSLGAVRSESPRAFAPTIRSDPSGLAPTTGSGNSRNSGGLTPASGARALVNRPPPAAATFMENPTVPSTELRASRLGSGHPTTSGGAFSVGHSSMQAEASVSTALGSRWRSLGLAVALAAGAVLVGTSLYRHEEPKVAQESVPAVSTPASGDRVTAIPNPLSAVAPEAVAEEAVMPKAVAPEAGVESPPPPAPKQTVTGSVGPSGKGAHHGVGTTPTPPSAPPGGAAAVPGGSPPVAASATAAQGGVVVTAPF
jgi:serine/threonine protein kinase